MAQVTTGLTDLTHLSWSDARHASALTGTLLKTYDDEGGRRIYYKLSDYRAGTGIVGHECVNEVVASRLLEILQIPHVSYRLVHALVRINEGVHETWLNAFDDFRRHGESKVALDTHVELNRHEGETPLVYCIRQGWQERIWQMFAFDYLILNRDRHGANIEVIVDRNIGAMRLAPLFDHGFSLLFRCRTNAEVAAFDVSADLPVQSYLSTHSAERNLSLIATGALNCMDTLHEDDREAIFDGLEEATTPIWRDTVWSMVWKRWRRLERLPAAR